MPLSPRKIQVFSPWPRDWHPARPGPPNNRFLREVLEARGLLASWIEPPVIPAFPSRGRWAFLCWPRFVAQLRYVLPRYLDKDALWLCLSPLLYPALKGMYAHNPLVLKTFGFVTYAKGILYRLRMPELAWALHHPPDLWIATDDGSKIPRALHEIASHSKILWLLNARPDQELAQPLPASPPFRILYVGGLNKLKGADRLYQIAKALLKRRPDVEFWVVGDGPLRPSLRALPNIRWLGVKSWPNTLQIYSQVHGVLQLNRYADWTLPLVEALQAARGVFSLSHGRGVQKLGSNQGVRWFRDTSSLIMAIENIDQKELLTLHHETEAGRSLFPTWSEVIEREMEELLQIGKA